MITLINEAIELGVSENITLVKGADESNTDHSFQVVTLGSPTAVSVKVEGSVDNNNFSCIVEHKLTAEELTAGSSLFHLVDKSIPVIRASITVLEGGVEPTVSMYYFKGK